MNRKASTNSESRNDALFGQAVVIGSSIAGLTAAQVLTDHFVRVTIIDRDQLSDKPDFRRGVPQARHAHTLPVSGQKILEQQFPGLLDELIARGAIRINGGSEMAFFIAGGWHEVKHRSTLVSMSSSRPLLDTTIYRRLSNHPRVKIIQEQEVVGLEVDRRAERVTGVRLRHRHSLTRHETKLAADLVLDASGRNSLTPEWLSEIGYTPPRESWVDAFSGYASRIYQRPADLNPGWKTLYIRPTPPDGTRGGLIIPIEGDRWHVTLVGMAKDYPPTDEDEFLAFARSLPTPQLYEAIKVAGPLTKPYGYRLTANRVRLYDRLPRYLEGLLVTGDAAYALNPVYAQGITAAVMGSQALEHSLQQQRNQQDLTGLASAFQLELSRVVSSPWNMATSQDQRWPLTEVAQQLTVTPYRHRQTLVTFQKNLSIGGALA